jgi:hypothetical protein
MHITVREPENATGQSAPTRSQEAIITDHEDMLAEQLHETNSVSSRNCTYHCWFRPQLFPRRLHGHNHSPDVHRHVGAP